jgi:hypothetical protein
MLEVDLLGMSRLVGVHDEEDTQGFGSYLEVTSPSLQGMSSLEAAYTHCQEDYHVSQYSFTVVSVFNLVQPTGFFTITSAGLQYTSKTAGLGSAIAPQRERESRFSVWRSLFGDTPMPEPEDGAADRYSGSLGGRQLTEEE